MTGAAVEADLRASMFGERRNHDVLFRTAAELEPWFGGLYLKGGEILVLSTDLGVDSERVTALLEGVFLVAGRPGLFTRASTARLVEAGWSFVELSRWLDRLRPILHEFGIQGVGIDERANRIELQVAEASGIEALAARALEMGVPETAMRVSLAQVPTLLSFVGGDSVEIAVHGGSNISQCTLTQGVTHMLPAVEPDSATYGITASHCTSDWTSISGDTLVLGGQAIAEEIWDHPRISDTRCLALVGHPTPFCRYSDAVLFQYYPAFAGSVLKHRVAAADSLHSEAMVFVGDTVRMRGAVSDTTLGEVTKTCHDQIVPNPPHANVGALCFGAADNHATEGDSGAPYWIYEDVGGVTKRLFVGILSYGTDNARHFSHAESVMDEIVPSGSGWGTICLSFPGPAVNPGSWTCWW